MRPFPLRLLLAISGAASLALRAASTNNVFSGAAGLTPCAVTSWLPRRARWLSKARCDCPPPATRTPLRSSIAPPRARAAASSRNGPSLSANQPGHELPIRAQQRLHVCQPSRLNLARRTRRSPRSNRCRNSRPRVLPRCAWSRCLCRRRCNQDRPRPPKSRAHGSSVSARRCPNH